MTKISFKEYIDSKKAFNAKHGNCRVDRWVDGKTIYKTLIYDDGAIWNEITRPVYDGLAKSYQTEMFDSDNSKSRYYFD